MYGRESQPCMAYEYGCLAPTSGEDAMIKEMRDRNNLWNALVEIERNHQAKVRQILTVPDDPTVPIKREISEIEAEIKNARQKARSGKVDVDTLKSKLKGLRAELKEARARAREERRQLLEAVRPALQELDRQRTAAVKDAVNASQLYWCNKEDVLNSYDAARRKAMKLGVDLRFHRWTGRGKVFVRYQNGLPVQDVFGSDTRLQIAPVPQEAWDSSSRSARRKLSKTVARLRVTSDSNRRPVWIELPMVMHRPLPPGGKIRSAAVVRERVGRRFRYKLVVIATIPERDIKAKPPAGAIAIDIGWRAVEGGLRVAYWADDGGNHGTLVLEQAILDRFATLRNLDSIRDKNFEEAKTALKEWLSGRAVPGWLGEETASLAAWRSQGRLTGLVYRWRENRFEGDGDIVQTLESWLIKENHLYDWEANLRDKVRRRRREEYRKFAAWVARNYGRVIMEDFDLRRVVRKPLPEDGTGGSQPRDWHRTIAAVSELRLAVESACRREGVAVTRAEAPYTTQRCHACGHTEKWDAAAQIFHTCPSCGAVYDQDYNAARVMLQQFSQENAI